MTVQSRYEKNIILLSLFNADKKFVLYEVVGAALPGVIADDLNVSVLGAPPATSNDFFLDAPAGKGERIVNKAIHAFPRLCSKNFIAVPSSAVAEALLDGSLTAHSTFNTPIPFDHGSFCDFSASSHLARQLREADLILSDEAVMAQNHSKEVVHVMLQDITRSTRLFAGKPIMFIGCFPEILPVINGGSKSEIVQ